MNGQFGQPTILGFVVFTTGLALAARKCTKKATFGTLPRPESRAQSPTSDAAPLRLCRAAARSCAPTPIKPMVLLIGNYPPDRQQSMQRFATMMLRWTDRRGQCRPN